MNINKQNLSAWAVIFLLLSPLLQADDHITPQPIKGLEVYPMGKTFPFMGYSGHPVRDAKNGFTVAGPDYGTAFSQPLKIRNDRYGKMRASGMPYPAFVGLDMHFHDAKKYKPLSADEIKRQITEQMKVLLKDPNICWWYIGPEEIRFWHANELEYLKTVTATIRELDPYHRPIWMYEPNHRTSEALTKTGRYQDIIGKGSYTNLAGFQKDRIWVRWSVEQEINAIQALKKKDHRSRIALVMPELCQDPKNPSDDILIPTWTRHDIYLGLMSGAKGVSIWSLFKRAGVKRTWSIWYQSYAEIGKELTGKLKLGDVFLFGEQDTKLTIKQTDGPQSIELFVGDRTKLELGTITEAERKGGSFTYPTLSSKAFRYKGSTYVFLCNSHPTKSIRVTTQLSPTDKAFILPKESPVPLKDSSQLISVLPPYAVLMYKIQSSPH